MVVAEEEEEWGSCLKHLNVYAALIVDLCREDFALSGRDDRVALHNIRHDAA